MFDEARAFLTSIDPLSVDDWLVWKEDWPDWRSPIEIVGLMEPIHRTMHVLPPPAPRFEGITQNSKLLEVELDIESLPKPVSGSPDVDVDLTGRQYVERAKKRYQKKLTLHVVGPNGEIFKTHSIDISVGGILLADVLPQWATGFFKVRISKPQSKQVVELTCSPVLGQNPNLVSRIAILPFQNLKDEKNLERWFEAA